MLKIKCLYLKNFKSYNGSHCFGPFDGFSAIIGENGTGKSNFFDAICFVLGANSSLLRCNQLKDLIYNGDFDTEKASVILEFSNGCYFKRRIYKKQGKSEYFYNGKLCSFADYKDKLKSVGISEKFQSFIIFQGDIQYIAGMKPKELTNLIEELSGSISLKSEYERLEKVNLKKQEEVELLDSKREDVANQKRNAKKEVNEVKEWKEQDEKLSIQKKELVDFQLFHLKNDYITSNNNINNISNEINDLQKKLKDIDDEIEESEKIKRNLNKLLRKLKKDSSSLQNKISEHHVIFDSLNDQKNENEIKSKYIMKEIDEKKLKTKEEKKLKGNILKTIKQYNQQYKLIIENRNDITSLIDNFNLIYKKEFNEIDKRKNDLSTLKSEIQLNENKKITSLRQLEFNKEKINEIDQHISNLPIIESPDSTHLNNLKKSLDDIEKQISNVTDQEKLYNQFKVSNKRQNLLRNMLSTLQQNIPNVYGFIRDLFRPLRRKYEKPIVASLAFFLDGIVVKDRETAQKCIELCKLKSLGCCTFFPLNNLKISNVCEPKDKHLLPLIDLIEFQEKNSLLFKYITNNIYYCENPKIALEKYRKKKWKKIVDINGTVYCKNGRITGGYSRSQSLLKYNDIYNQIIQKKEELNSNHEKINNDLIAEENKFNDQNLRYKNYTEQVHELKIKKEEHSNNILHINENIQQVEQIINDLHLQKELLEKEIASFMDQMKQKDEIFLSTQMNTLLNKYPNIRSLFNGKSFQEILNFYQTFQNKENEISHHQNVLDNINDSLLSDKVNQLKDQLNQNQKQKQEIVNNITNEKQIIDSLTQKLDDNNIKYDNVFND